MTKISTAEQGIMLVGRAAIAYVGLTHSPKAFAIGAIAGALLSEPTDKSVKISDHLKIDALTCRTNPAWIQAIVGITFFITHCDHHAFGPIPTPSLVCGYVVGAYTTSLWQGNKSS